LATTSLCLKAFLQSGQSIQAPIESRRIDILGQRQIADAFTRLLYDERTVLNTQKARSNGWATDADEVRQFGILLANLVADPGAQAWMLQRGGWRITSVHQVAGPVVVTFLGRHRADYRQLIGLLGNQR